MEIKCDVLVVGGGPAGLSASILCGKKGLSTLVIEKKNLGGPDQTSYDITEGNSIQNILPVLNITPHKISSISEWNSPHHRFILDSNIQDYYFKRGPETDSLENQLLSEAVKNDVKVFFNVSSLSLSISHNNVHSVTLNKKHMKIVPRYLIAADGPFSTVRQRLKTKVKKIAVFEGFGAVFQTKSSLELPHAKIYFDQRFSPGGYIYSGRVGSDIFYCIVIDKASAQGMNLKSNLRRFLKKQHIDYPAIRTYFRGQGIAGFQKGVIGNTLFVGGAAHLYDPFLGYGLNFAMESGSTAAHAIINDNVLHYTRYINTITTRFRKRCKARDIWKKADNDFFDNLIQSFEGQGKKDKNINEILKMFEE